MYSPAIYLFAAIGIAVSSAVPVTAENLDNEEYDLLVREAFADYGIDFDELVFLEARADTWGDTALEAAKAVVPYAANHVNLPNSKANLALGLAGKIIEKTPTSQQVASQKARQQMPSGGQQIRQAMQKEKQEQSAQKATNQAANQAKLDNLNSASKESADKMRNGAGKSQESSAHPVQDALKAKPAVPNKPSALSNLKFPKQSSSGGSGSSSGKPALQRSNSMPVQSSKPPTPKLQRSNTAPAKPPVPAKPKALQGKKVKRNELMRKRMVELLMEEGDIWWW